MNLRLKVVHSSSPRYRVGGLIFFCDFIGRVLLCLLLLGYIRHS
jgi:hypothetical protein